MPRLLKNPVCAIGITLSILFVGVVGAAPPQPLPAYRVKDIEAGSGSTPLDGYLGGFGVLGGSVYFAGHDAANGVELWKSDGTPGGTVLVKDIVAGPGDSTPTAFTRVGNTLFFIRLDNALMKTDGTAAGTVVVRSFSNCRSSINVAGTLFLSASDGANNNELWKSDGTAAGTVMVKDIAPGFGGVDIDAPLLAIGNTVYFVGQDGVNGRELWKSDGTAAGTVMVKNIGAGGQPGLASMQADLTNVNGVVFFVANDWTANGTELWKSDGTEAGTVMVKDISQPGDSNPTQLTNVGGTLYFVASNNTVGTSYGQELMKSDGTAAGTVMVKDIYPGIGSSNTANLTNVNGVLFFTAHESTNGNELWKTYGTEATTAPVKDINPGLADSVPLGPSAAQAVAVGHRLFFRADDGTSGVELWRSDGTAAGTVRLQDIQPGSGGSNPTLMTRAGSLLYFAADDGTTGLEPWAVNVNEDRTVDFDGDRKTDLTVYNPPSGLWYIRNSVSGSMSVVGYGGTGFLPVPGDYDGDLKTDVAVYHPPSESWFTLSSATGADTMTAFGRPGAAPVRGDFDRDGITDFGLFQDSTAVWWVRFSSSGFEGAVAYGGSGYTTVPGDYDGDGQSDLGVYHPPSGLWFVRNSSTGTDTTTGFGGTAYTPVRGDFDGDGKNDLALFHDASGLWYIKQSSTAAVVTIGFGATGYLPVPENYDGDGMTDLAVYHPPSGLWYMRSSLGGGTTTAMAFGGPGYNPVN